MLKKASALRENLINAERRVNNQLSGCTCDRFFYVSLSANQRFTYGIYTDRYRQRRVPKCFKADTIHPPVGFPDPERPEPVNLPF